MVALTVRMSRLVFDLNAMIEADSGFRSNQCNVDISGVQRGVRRRWKYFCEHSMGAKVRAGCITEYAITMDYVHRRHMIE